MHPAFEDFLNEILLIKKKYKIAMQMQMQRAFEDLPKKIAMQMQKAFEDLQIF